MKPKEDENLLVDPIADEPEEPQAPKETPEEQDPEDTNEFSLVCAEEEITLIDKNGTPRPHILRELTGDERDKWVNMMKGKMNFDTKTGKPTGLKSVDGVESDLVFKTLWTLEGKKVPIKQISAFPSKTLSLLFKRCLKINGLDNKAEEREKND